MKNRVTELLESRQIPYRLLPHRTPAISVEDAAEQRGIDTKQMVKAILLRDMDNNYALACVPGNRSADPRKVRALLASRRMTCVSLSEVPDITGYQVGTLVPLMLKTPMPVFFDSSLLGEEEVTISSGSNMAGVALHINDLVRLCDPVIADIIRD